MSPALLSVAKKVYPQQRATRSSPSALRATVVSDGGFRETSYLPGAPASLCSWSFAFDELRLGRLLQNIIEEPLGRVVLGGPLGAQPGLLLHPS